MSDANQAEWICVQQSYDKMETQALWLKVIAMVLWLWLIQTESSLLLLLGVIALFWLHEAIWKTQQSRALQRLLTLEQAIQAGQNAGCQWQSAWQQQRPTLVGLIKDYSVHALKPTVAVTYLALLGATLWRHFF